MPKQKSRKAFLKRCRVTRTGKIIRNRAGRRHLLSGKSRKQKRQLRRKAVVLTPDAARIKRAMQLT